MKLFHLHLVSDSTGDTIHSVSRACTAQFDGTDPVEHFWNLVRTERQLDLVIEGLHDNPGVVLYTLVNEQLRRRLLEVCRELQLPCIAILDPIISALANYLGQESQSQPGRQHLMDTQYFQRIDAMDYALGHDDGQSSRTLAEADVILLGVSRVSKTPTCLYLANRGIKAANVPFVPGIALPHELEEGSGVDLPLVVGLTADPERLLLIRRERLRILNQTEHTAYVDPEAVRQEVLEARRYFQRRGWPVLDATRRSIEETSAEILRLLAQRREAAQRAAKQAGRASAP